MPTDLRPRPFYATSSSSSLPEPSLMDQVNRVFSSPSVGGSYSKLSNGHPSSSSSSSPSANSAFREIWTVWRAFTGLQKVVVSVVIFGLVWLLMDKPVLQSEFGLLETKSCSLSSIHPGRPPIQYALMIDAGSTGSRIHIYRFNFCNGPSPTLEDEIFLQIKPGLSSYPDTPKLAAKSLDVLLKAAVRNIPSRFWGCTPVAVKATAGLRLLGEAKSQAILDAVRKRLETKYPFQVIKKDGVVVMDGKDEGVYAWITVNYLLDYFGKKTKVPTAAIMDLGGGSTQIVFEPKQVEMQPGDHKYDLKLGGHEYVLYQHSYLNYGLMEGRKSLKRLKIPEKFRTTPEEEEFPHPCLPKGFSESFESVKLIGTGGGWEKCFEYMKTSESIFTKSSCKVKPCSFDGVYQPSISSSFPSPSAIYAFSYFYDRAQDFYASFDLSGNGGDSKKESKEVEDGEHKEELLKIGKILDMGKRICSLSTTDHAGIKENPHFCIDLVFIYALLNVGYEIEDVRELVLAKKINGFETGWCLGASMVMVEETLGMDSGLSECPVFEGNEVWGSEDDE